MAIAHRLGTHRDIALKLDWPAFDPAVHRLVLLMPERSLRLDVIGVDGGGRLRLGDTAFAFERALVEHGDAPLHVVVTDRAQKTHLTAEPLLFHQSFFAPLVDFASMALPGYGTAPYARPGLLAACTHVYNDPVMAQLWERHYAKFVPHAQLYVIDHGSEPPVREVLSPNTQVIRLPRGATDQANIAQFCNHFQRFLLSQYRWVIHVDADELLVPEDGFDAFVARLAADAGPPRIVEPGQAVDLVMDPAGDAPLDPSRPITHQRRHLVPNPACRKPALVSRPATWGPGFHFAVEAFAVAEDKLLWLVHLDMADVALAVARHRKWLDTPRSASDAQRVDHSCRAVDADGQRARLRAALASPHAFHMPGWMRGIF